MHIRISFFCILTLLGVVGAIASYAMYRQGWRFLGTGGYLWCFIVPPLLFSLAHLGDNILPASLVRICAYIGGIGMGALYYSILFSVVFCLAYVTGKICHWPQLVPYAAKIISICVLCLVCGGVYNALHPVCRKVELTTAKALNKDMKIVCVSDIHLGALFGKAFARKLAQRINALEPDLVLIGGDIIDGNLAFVEREGSLAPLGTIKAPLGTYAVYGNHDKLFNTHEQERKELQDLGIKLICDGQEVIQDEIEITGLNDYGKGAREGKFDIDGAGQTRKELFKIFLEHQPRHISRAAKAGFDLSFAGHTHAGQFFPNRLVTKRIYELDYGAKYFGSMLAIVSNGYGLWGIPLRVGPAPEIILVEIKKAL